MTVLWKVLAYAGAFIATLLKIGAINAVKEQSTLFKEDMSRPVKYRAYKKRLTLGTPFNLGQSVETPVVPRTVGLRLSWKL